jgi:hypothetical protein
MVLEWIDGAVEQRFHSLTVIAGEDFANRVVPAYPDRHPAANVVAKCDQATGRLRHDARFESALGDRQDLCPWKPILV